MSSDTNTLRPADTSLKGGLETKVFTHVLVRATDLQVFRTERGPRRMRMPYWIEGATTLSFDFINETTSLEELKYFVEQGKVWIRESDAS